MLKKILKNCSKNSVTKIYPINLRISKSKKLNRNFSSKETEEKIKKILDLKLEKKQITYNKKKILSSFGVIYGCSALAFYLEAVYPAFGIALLGFLYNLST